MNRLDRRFQELAEAGRAALIPFVTAGHPEPGWTVEILRSLAAAGADVIELGVPFSDPMADGPVIQRSSEAALRHGVTTARVLEMVREFRRDDAATPIVLMGYLNPIVRMGVDSFADSAAAAGVDACLIVDCPAEESALVRPALQAAGLHQIFLLAPTTREERVVQVASAAGGFAYYVALKGVTGAGHLDVAFVARELERIRRHVQVPLAVGFGVKTSAHVKALAPYADGVVVGSELVAALDGCADLGVARQVCADVLEPMAAAVAESAGEDRRATA